MLFTNLPAVPAAERLKLIDKLTRLGIPQPTNLYNAGVRHPEYLQYMTDAEILAVTGITQANLTTIRQKTGAFVVFDPRMM